MRALPRLAALGALLGVAAAGCNRAGDAEATKPIDPSLSQVTLKVPGMH